MPKPIARKSIRKAIRRVRSVEGRRTLQELLKRSKVERIKILNDSKPPIEKLLKPLLMQPDTSPFGLV